MYIVRSDVTVNGGRFAGLEAWTTQRVEHLRAQKGFQEYLVLRSLGYPGNAANLVAWENRENSLAYLESPERQLFVQANPYSALFTLNRPEEACELVREVARPGQAGIATLVDWNINPGVVNAAAFESARKELFELRREHSKGFVSNRLLKFLGAPSRYLVVMLWRSVDDYRAAQAIPQIQEFGRTHSGQYATTPRAHEYHEVRRQA